MYQNTVTTTGRNVENKHMFQPNSPHCNNPSVYNHCMHRLPCGLCRLTNRPCNNYISHPTPVWVYDPIITC